MLCPRIPPAAALSMRSRTCSGAVAAAVNLLLSPEPYLTFSATRMLSPSGRCHTFDAAADGYVRGEGCAALWLCGPRAAAQAGMSVLGCVAGVAVNQSRGFAP